MHVFYRELGECKWFVQERKLTVHVLLNEFGHVSKHSVAS